MESFPVSDVFHVEREAHRAQMIIVRPRDANDAQRVESRKAAHNVASSFRIRRIYWPPKDIKYHLLALYPVPSSSFHLLGWPA